MEAWASLVAQRPRGHSWTQLSDNTATLRRTSLCVPLGQPCFPPGPGSAAGDTSQREVVAPRGPFGRSLMAALWTEARGLGCLSHCGWKTQWLPSLTDCKGLERRVSKQADPRQKVREDPPEGPGGAGFPPPAQPPQRSPGPSPQGLFHVNAGIASFFFPFFPSLCCYHFENK